MQIDIGREADPLIHLNLNEGIS